MNPKITSFICIIAGIVLCLSGGFSIVIGILFLAAGIYGFLQKDEAKATAAANNKLHEKEREEALEKQKQEFYERREKAFINPIYIDTETTGLKPDGTDEILQLAIVDKDGEVIFNEMFKPEYRQRWPKATSINGITPAMVKNCKPFSFYKDSIQEVFDNASAIVGYNVDFDIEFLENAGLQPRGVTVDVMQDFSQFRKVYDSRRGGYKWFKLKDAADYFGYDWGNDTAHDAASDAKATRFIALEMMNKSEKP